MDEALTQLGVGAIVAILIIREVLTFLKTKMGMGISQISAQNA